MIINLCDKNIPAENTIYVCRPSDHDCDTRTVLAEKYGFDGECGKLFKTAEIKDGEIYNTVYCGVGEDCDTCDEAIRQAFTTMFKSLKDTKAHTWKVLCEDNSKRLANLFALTAKLALYEFEGYKTDKSPCKEYTFNLVADCEGVKTAYEKGVVLGDSVNIARDLGNKPAAEIYPESLAEIAKKYGDELGFKVTIFDKEELTKQGCGAILGVGQGSKKPPVMITMEYNGAGDEAYSAFIGKGITFDSGGYFLKGRDGILTMKTDMCGAANVIGLMVAVAKTKLKKNVICVIPAAENLIGSDALLPGDVITTRSKKTVEITNTDAEGRLVLADALDYVCSMENVKEVIDIATLTGATANTFGGVCCGAMGKGDEFFAKLQDSSNKSGEKFWRMPLFEEYGKNIISNIADYRNTATMPAGGALTAGMFLKAFTYDKPWIHLDIAGMANRSSEKGYMPVGATGFGVRLMYGLLED